VFSISDGERKEERKEERGRKEEGKRKGRWGTWIFLVLQVVIVV
jgi:hypothetical protein